MPELYAALSFIVALGVSWIATPLAIRLAVWRGWFDVPDGQRRVHDVAVPRIGGVGVFAGLVIALALPVALLGFPWAEHQVRFLAGLAVGGAIMFVAGLLDDLVGLRPITKVICQGLAASVVMWVGFLPETLVIGYGTELHLGLFAIPLMLLWTIGVTNSFNLIDGLNGLAGGVGVVACSAAIVAGAVNGRWAGVAAAAALAGAIIGFLRYNFPRARVFLGDSGSMSIGFVLAVTLLRTATTRDGAVIATVPVFAMLLPFLDTLLAIARRWLRNTRLSGADARHIHHRLVALGLSHRRATVALWLIAAALTGYGLLMSFAPPLMSWGLSVGGAVAFLLVAIYGSNFLAYYELVVAKNVVFSGPGRARRLIQDQIRATDLAERVRRCRTADELDEVLEASAIEFGFLHLALISNSSDVSLILPALTRQRVWRFEYPVCCGSDPRGYTLSAWCETSSATRPFGAERVCRLLAPAIEQWLVKSGPPQTPVVPMARIPEGAELRVGRSSGERARVAIAD